MLLPELKLVVCPSPGLMPDATAAAGVEAALAATAGSDTWLPQVSNVLWAVSGGRAVMALHMRPSAGGCCAALAADSAAVAAVPAVCAVPDAVVVAPDVSGAATPEGIVK